MALKSEGKQNPSQNNTQSDGEKHLNSTNAYKILNVLYHKQNILQNKAKII